MRKAEVIYRVCSRNGVPAWHNTACDFEASTARLKTRLYCQVFL